MAFSSRRFPRLLVLAPVLGLTLLGLHPASASNDSLFSEQWSMGEANVPAAWPATTGGHVRIGIVDSGINRNHDELRGRVVAAATCVGGCTNADGAGDDVAGHGTHVAGIAAATMGNGTGIAGVAPGADLVVARVFTCDGSSPCDDPSATIQDVADGIDWVVANGAKVVNLSLGAGGGGLLGGVIGGGGNENSPLGPAVQRAWDNGAIPVLAAGNENASLFGANGSYGNINAIVVGATTPSGAVASYSNGLAASTKWGLVAPGGDSDGQNAHMIVSAFDGSGCSPPHASNCYKYLSGTSMAAPMVTGTVALLLSQGLSREVAIKTLLDTADRKGTCGAGCQGHLNVGNAVAVHAGSGGGGGSDTTATPTTKKKSTGTTRAPSAATTAAPTTAAPAPDTTVPEPTTSTTRKPPKAFVLNTTSNDSDDVSTGLLAAGVAALLIAAAGTVLKLRRNATGA